MKIINKKPISSKPMKVNIERLSYLGILDPKTKAKNDWFDTHVEVMSSGSSKENKKIKEIIKKKIINT